MISVSMPDGSTHVVRRLLSQPSKPIDEDALLAQLEDPNLHDMHRRYIEWQLRKGTQGGNTKTSKGVKKSYTTVGLSLAPNKESGYNVCPKTTPGCTTACIYNGGLTTAWKQIKPSQIAKTRAFFQDQFNFLVMLHRELFALERRYKDLVCRLNVYSDLPWERLDPELFSKHQSIQFYDYTKLPERALASLRPGWPTNYHLTFSRSENNEADCRQILAAGGNVAVVFPQDRFPAEYLGAPVIDGDVTDLRFLDPSPVIIGLKAKNRFGRADATGFVVRLPLPMVNG